MGGRLGLGGLLLATGAACALFLPEPAGAHALIGRQDLPIPEWLFAWAAAIVLIVSFVALSLAWREPRLEREDWHPVAPRLSAFLLAGPAQLVAGVLGVALLVVTIWSGLAGTEAPDRNFSVTFVFVTVWLGLVLASILVGDVFRAFNPWRAAARGVSAVFRLVAGRSAPVPFAYPERLGRWPAVVGLLGFLWLELIYANTGFQVTVGLNPHTVAVAAIVYTGITFTAMALFGVERWCERGETFSVYFNMFSRLSVLEVREGRLGRRRLLSGLAGWAAVPGSLALVLVTIGGTTFDGAQEGALSEPISEVFELLGDAGLGPVAALRVTTTLFFAAVLAGVGLLFAGGVRGMRTVRHSPRAGQLARAFAHSLVPIGLAYLAAHYFSLFVFQEQAQFTYLLSDPLGNGSDYFGTASGGVDYGVIGAEAVWYVQVGALVAGHVAGLVLAHDRAISVFGDPTDATRSQYWMLAVMVAFTTLGLFLLSQANA